MNKHVKILLTLKSLGFAFLFSTGLVAHAAVDNGDVNPASTTAMQQSKKISGIITDEKGEANYRGEHCCSRYNDRYNQ